ncbi:MAG TPA: ATP-binding protein [Verrucomicrobiae bacterium]|jgi:signal transduction histidine kinase
MSKPAANADAENSPSATVTASASAGKTPSGILLRAEEFADAFLFDECLTNPENGRRARLISRFGLLGFFFGLFFATFYLLIGHHWGTGIVLVCGFSFGSVPFLMKFTRSLNFAGNLLAAIMTAGFSALCCVEGGLSGHAVAWLAAVPLCALLMVGKEAARWWLVVCFITVSVFGSVGLAGFTLPMTYSVQWQPLVSFAGYLALVLFMFYLGIIFETSREQAFNKMQQAIAELKASNDQLLSLNNEKNEFLSIAAHDLKNPLTTVILGAEIIQRAELLPRHKSVAQDIIQAGTRMRGLITDLLDTNAIEEGRFVSKLERCDLNALLAESLKQNGTIAARKEITLMLVSSAEAWARTDRAATLQIFDNFISNAIKYSPYKSTVWLRASAAGGKVSVAIADEGPGLSAADQEKLFRKFTRLTARPTGGESSNGLGLSIVKRLAEAMGGSVECQSILGSGSTFTVHLPMWSEAMALPSK